MKVTWATVCLTVTASLAGTPAAATGSGVTVLDDVNGGRFVARPPYIATTSDTVLGRLPWDMQKGYLRWQTWNRRGAKGVGTFWSYAGVDTWTSRRARVTLSQVNDGHFTVMRIRAKYNGKVRLSTARLARTGSSGWYWASV